MAQALLIVESPTKARTLTKFLGKDYQVLASGGHIMDLPKSKLGVDVEQRLRAAVHHHSRQGTRPSRSSRRRPSARKQVYLAPDPDREGEAIAWHLAQQLGNGAIEYKRLDFNEITRARSRRRSSSRATST